MENRNPGFEQIKYAWEAKHRDLVIDGILKFGFGRFCKVRNEGCLVAHPIQDLEIFIHACRGSPTKNAMELDVDMKAKVVTTEELSHAVGNCFKRRKQGILSVGLGTSMT